ncbi:nuclease SbcCD subunit C [Halobacillus andaensis]|uniref:Nuclease SbcCD subunit C n=1 Tax=Halobacillus andaensis TaxID=1176239 RepID=A0A917AZ53_HALAA|nr:AAA family ATPase [Halobacillus andaensis]MBP2003332.1 exonuclease SbcC [Halobacillus andaensis]GGF09862.1 nuclease SbcCD subunit C [Halobacillus andaensis]
MRALHLTVKAFGPFKEKQTIDFSQLGSETIFLVTGPTGAGKTTIFDAMCFALYGRASGTDRDQDTLKSHFSNEEDTTIVDFTFMLRGKQYRIERMPKQWRKKERGEGYKEEPTKAHLYQQHNGEERLLASKIKEVNEMIEELLRLDYDQFRKMIMIPQGEFRKLISENSKEREEILQKIFRTQFYSELTDHLREQKKSLEKDMEQFEWKIEQEIEKINWISEEQVEIPEDPHQVIQKLEEMLERQELEKKLVKDQLRVLSEQLDKVQDRYYHAKTIDELYKELDRLMIEQKDLHQQQSEMDREAEVLHLGKKAHELKPYERQMHERKQELDKLAASLKENIDVLKDMETRFKRTQEEYEAEKAKESVRDQLKEELQKTKEAQGKLESLLDIQQKVTQIDQKQDQFNKRLTDLSSRKQQLAEEREKKSQLAFKEREITSKVFDLKEKTEREKRNLSSLHRLMKEWNTLQQLRENYQSLKKETDESRERKEELKRKYDEAVEKLKEHRAYHLALEVDSGSPCPVCGSCEHPDLATQPKGVLSNEEMDAIKQTHDRQEQKYLKMHESMTSARAEGESHKQLVDTLYGEVHSLIDGDLSTEVLQQAAQQLEEKLRTNTEGLTHLETELKTIHEAADQLSKIEDQMNELTKQEEDVNNQLRKWAEEKVARQTEIENLKSNYAFPTFDLSEMNEFVKKAEQKLHDSLKNWENIQKDYTQKHEEVQQMRTKKDELERYLVEVEEMYQNKAEEFNQTLDQLNFDTVTAYKEALLTEAEMNILSQKLNEFNQRKAVVHDRLTEIKTKLKEEKRPVLDELKQAYEEHKEKVNHKQKELHDFQVVYRQNENILLSMASLIEEQKEFAERYYDLAEVSNLARGDNALKLSLERYVLASYLDEILVQANIRLDQMTDHRYQLLRSDALAKRGAQSGLELEVIDHHTGQKRSVKTLSGGEGFKASLSLALGMADVVQSHAGGVQLETLFIDEGFGTLDEQSLEQAIGCLRTLQDGNRMLGIISHVPQLKEEIPAKLHIHSGPEGSTVQMAFQ